MEQNITTSDLQRLDLLKFEPVSVHGGGPELRDRFVCRTPQNWYETLVDQLVTPSTRWLLTMWKMLQPVGLHYPEKCALTTYGWAPGKTDGAHGVSGR